MKINDVVSQVFQIKGTVEDRDVNLEKVEKSQRRLFYQTKYEYYKKMVLYLMVTSVLGSLCYWFTDCMLYGRTSLETLPARLTIIPLFLIYLYFTRNTDNYRICVPMAYLLTHAIIFCTEWAVFNLENRTHANEGLMVIECIFIFLGMVAPKHYSIPMHAFVLVDIVIANYFIHFEDFITILSLHVIVIMGSEYVITYIERAFKDRFIAQNKINFMTIHDQLTRVYNRNVIPFICVKDTNLLNIKNAGMLILDIDFFKKINDTYGHEEGDRILIRFADVICDTIRKNDIVIRWGGEEFLIILPETNEEILQTVAGRLNKAINKKLDDFKITASIGGTMYTGEDYHDSVKRADEALYYVKQHGRNGFRIV